MDRCGSLGKCVLPCVQAYGAAADFLEQFVAALAPCFVVRCFAFGIAAAGENDIAYFQVRDRTAVR